MLLATAGHAAQCPSVIAPYDNHADFPDPAKASPKAKKPFGNTELLFQKTKKPFRNH
jgi:hypothetical protein